MRAAPEIIKLDPLYTTYRKFPFDFRRRRGGEKNNRIKIGSLRTERTRARGVDSKNFAEAPDFYGPGSRRGWGLTHSSTARGNLPLQSRGPAAANSPRSHTRTLSHRHTRTACARHSEDTSTGTNYDKLQLWERPTPKSNPHKTGDISGEVKTRHRESRESVTGFLMNVFQGR